MKLKKNKVQKAYKKYCETQNDSISEKDFSKYIALGKKLLWRDMESSKMGTQVNWIYTAEELISLNAAMCYRDFNDHNDEDDWLRLYKASYGYYNDEELSDEF